MPAKRSSSPNVLRDFGRVASAQADNNCARLLFDAFSAALRHRGVDLNPFDADQNTFDVAAHTYGERNPDVPEAEVRRAVANIICRSLSNEPGWRRLEPNGRSLLHADPGSRSLAV
jgi:hypothetical protein